MRPKRQRRDGTWTYTSEEWDAKWYWPVGTRVSVTFRDGVRSGVVTKQNSVSVWVLFDAGPPARMVSVRHLTREGQR